MASEPKKPIEEMLEEAARARRAAFGSDPKMPNPMRARLHDEIGRSERPERDDRKSWLLMFWPRIAVAAALATLLVLGPVMWWQESHPSSGGMQLAERDVRSANQLSEAGVPADKTLTEGPAAAASIAPEINLADNKTAQLEAAATPGTATDSLEASGSFAEARPAPGAPAAVTKGFISKQETGLAKGDANIATATGAAAAPSSTNEEQRADRLQQAQTAMSSRAVPGTADARARGSAPQRFAQQSAGQAFRNNSQDNQRANVLNSFQVQQEGTEIRVVDSDGSTYTGKLEPAAQFGDRMAAKAKSNYAARREAASSSAASPQSRFRASGYNVSLKKTLVFEGDYAGAQQQQQSLVKDKEAEEKQPPARIVGTARVHGEPPVEVDATEVLPRPAEQKTEK